ncbi:uncharacterized protein LOC132630725 [Lycium barbarum]|uniref:uncharacterized protein LOC132630725 n=1 Tax=Lycium barbarum TaxID=112863 RepID=UPI00293EA23F|nr:uncharacterized protein LOC132630725 [Lycium barbarum]
MALEKWSKDTYGNIFRQISTIEDTIKVKELQFELNPSMLNRINLHKAQTELNSYLHLEKEYWKQKSGMRWFKDGDRNTKFIHSYVKGRRKKLALQRIQNIQGDWISSNDYIGEEAVTFYQDQFRELATSTDYEMLKMILALISTEQNESLIALPSNEEVKLAVYGLNGDSTSGPDGFCYSPYFRALESEHCGECVVSTRDFRDVNKRNKLHNVVVKLDMAKAYDRVSWIFLTKVLRQFGFSEVIIDMVWRLVSNNWISVLVNGQSHGFFHSTRGLKQGDPLSPTLFIIAAEVLATNLNADPVSLKEMMKILWDYEKTSGLLVNNDKSSFYVHEKVPAAMTMLVYLLSAMTALKGVIDQLHKIFAKLLWSNTAGVKVRHWVAWDKMCLPKCEGGLGFRSLHDISKAVFAKLWWNFRTNISLWGAFMGNKYCKKLHPVIAQAKGASNVWKKLVAVRDDVEHQIWWQLKGGTSSFWFDNWTKQGSLYFVGNELAIDEEIEEFLAEENVEYIQDTISPKLIQVDNDKTWWMGETNGKFTVKSAWEETRLKQDSLEAYRFI